MDGGQNSFLGSIQTAVRECAVNNKSCEYALRLCSVAFRCARWAPFPRPYHNRRVGCLMLCRQRVNRLEQSFLVTDHRSRGFRVTTCRLWLTFVSGLDHYNVLITPRVITTNIKHVIPSEKDENKKINDKENKKKKNHQNKKKKRNNSGKQPYAHHNLS